MPDLTYIDTKILVDCLRKSLLFQTPQPVFLGLATDEEPEHFLVKIKRNHYAEVMRLIQKAGGWTLPREARVALLKAHEERARKAHGDGIDYDLSGLEQGDLYAMYSEAEGIAELAAFRAALGEEIEARSRPEAAQ